ncbi:MFS transporter [Microbacterium sp. P06]|uniref:MFS transporter n=1 Tax=Microbacterium sp. P06 TaxID=3366949 RepID=UPI003745100A
MSASDRDDSVPSAPPATANTGAVAAMGLDLQVDKKVPGRTVLAWAFWDWATQPFNSVILTFIFASTLYLTGEAFLPADVAALPENDPVRTGALADLAAGYGWGGTVAGLLILLFAPVLGQRADASGRQKRWLAGATGLLVACMFALFFVRPEPELFVWGVALIAAGSVFSEIAGVNYNALLIGIANPKNIGRISGLGWGFGYIGGIVALTLVIVFYLADWFGLPADDGLPFRLIAVGCAVWAIVFSVPLFFAVPEPSSGREIARVSFFASYRLLIKDVIGLYRNTETRPTFWFLVSSAVFRDGLAGVFAYGAIIAGGVFGFDFIKLVIFGIAANLVAGISTILAGRLDDRFGAKKIIVTALIGMIIAGLAVFFLRDGGQVVFWIGGLILCAFVGPAQAAARSFLARVTPAGREGEIFGLYATTGRAASWISSALWSLLIVITSVTAFGILGIVIVLVVGLALLLPVRTPRVGG